MQFLQLALQNVQQLASAPATMIQLILQYFHGSLSEKYGSEANQLRTFIAHCKVFMETRPAELPTERVTFFIELFIGFTANRVLLMIEGNNPIPDNYKNCMGKGDGD